ncbi:MAG: SIMPL domain-containing protein [Clostridia bacterium]|nr:SIMPL domain-containing protein [Clostridia bacterium]
MKKRNWLLIVLASFAMLLLGIPCAMAQNSPAKITVQGNGSVNAEPDVVVVRMSASSFAENMLDAQTAISGVVAAANEGFAALGIAPEDVVTVSYGYYPRYSYDTEPAELVGYQATHELQVTCRDISLLDSVITAATDSGIAEIGDVSFDVSDKRELYRQALELAIGNAGDKAAAMAAASGLTVVSLDSLTENQGYDARYAVMTAAKEADTVNTGIRSGSMSVSASVTAVYIAQ